MPNILGIGTSALLSLQNALNTTGHNIANVNTEGYSRQRVDFVTTPPQLGSGAFIGSGVTVDSVRRVYDQFLVDEVRGRTASQSNFESFHTLSSRLDSIVADSATGIGPTLQSFFNAVQDVANNPAGIPERQVLLGEANVLADRFHNLNNAFNSLNDEINSRLEVLTSEINSLARNIAELNNDIARATALAGGQPPNDLLDTRDLLITELSGKVGVTTVVQSDGSINVMIGNGQPLVIGSGAEQLQTFTNPYDASRLDIGHVGSVGGVTDISRTLSGGELQGVLSFRDQVLQPAINQLGVIATGLTATFNVQHNLGIDLKGLPGGDFFNPLSAVISPHANNGGTASVSVIIDDATALTASDYLLRFDGTQYQLTRVSDNTVQTGAGPFSMDGLTITPSGTPDIGDSFLIRPAGNASSLFAVAVTTADGIAAAAPLRSSSTAANSGSAVLNDLAVTDASGLPLAGQITLTFNPDALGTGVPGFDVSGIAGGPLAYDPATESNGKSFVLGDAAFSIAGVPDAGDSFVIENNLDGDGDNRNALALADLQTEKLFDGGLSSYQDVYGSLIADIGIKTRQAESGMNTENILLQRAIDARDSVSGVNLDEEAANLIRYQQAYQAAAQIIAIADNLFQTLLDATRR